MQHSRDSTKLTWPPSNHVKDLYSVSPINHLIFFRWDTYVLIFDCYPQFLNKIFFNIGYFSQLNHSWLHGDLGGISTIFDPTFRMRDGASALQHRREGILVWLDSSTFTLCTVQCTLCTVHCELCIVQKNWDGDCAVHSRTYCTVCTGCTILEWNGAAFGNTTHFRKAPYSVRRADKRAMGCFGLCCTIAVDEKLRIAQTSQDRLIQCNTWTGKREWFGA